MPVEAVQGDVSEALKGYLSTLPEEQQQQMLAAIQADQQAVGMAAVDQQLFPGGLPTNAGVPNFDYFSNMGKPPPLEDYVDSTTGAIRRADGVRVDPSATPDTGVYFDNTNPDQAGSSAWFSKVQKSWKKGTVEKWRKRLAKLGYDVAKNGAWDVRFRQQLEAYYRNKAFYGDVMPIGDLPGSVAGDQRLHDRDAYDPVMIRQDARTVLQELYAGDEPSEAEIDTIEKFVRDQVHKLNKKGGHDVADAQHIQLRAKEMMADEVSQMPSVQVAQKYDAYGDDPNTGLMDSMLSLSQLVG